MPGPRDGLRAVLYDWDGTLVDSAAKSYRCYVKVFSTYGIAYDQESGRFVITGKLWPKAFEVELVPATER